MEQVSAEASTTCSSSRPSSLGTYCFLFYYAVSPPTQVPLRVLDPRVQSCPWGPRLRTTIETVGASPVVEHAPVTHLNRLVPYNLCSIVFSRNASAQPSHETFMMPRVRVCDSITALFLLVGLYEVKYKLRRLLSSMFTRGAHHCSHLRWYSDHFDTQLQIVLERIVCRGVFWFQRT